MMTESITTEENLSYNHHRIDQKKNDWSGDDLSAKMAHLCSSINDICQQRYVPFDEIFKSSNSTLGKLYDIFLSLRDKKDHLVNPKIFNELILTKTEGLLIKLNQTNKHSINFIQFIKQIQLLAKENQLSKEYLYKKLLQQTFLHNNPNQNNNALDASLPSHNFLINEYNNDLSALETYFIRHSKTSSDHQMNCFTFIKCLSQDIKLNQIDNRLQLNDIFYQIYSSLVNQGIYIPASDRIDFHGFILCLQQIAQTFHINLRILIKTLIDPKNTSMPMEYKLLAETLSSRRSSAGTIDSIGNIQLDGKEYLCRVCKNKILTRQETTHTPEQCLSQRCQFLEAEVIRLKDHNLKSHIQTKELENKITLLEDAVKALTAPKQQQAAPYGFGVGHKQRKELKRVQSEDVVAPKADGHYDNILLTRKPSQRERVGLFGSLGASSQNH